MQIEIIRYNDCHKEEWDKFVKESKNGTFLFERNYMDYHKDRFTDCSLMVIYDGKLRTLFPATHHSKKKEIISHGGLTYGSLITDKGITTTIVLEIFQAVLAYYRENTSAKKVIYRTIPYIYHQYPSDEDLYALFRNDARLTERKISSTIKISEALPFRGRRKLTNAAKSRMRILEDNDFAAFWEILGQRLMDKYGVAPVHSLEEIELLHKRFPDNIRLFRVTDNADTTLGGVVTYVMKNVVHCQYICTNDEGRRTGALDYLYEYFIKDRFAHLEYLDFGISVEDGGHYLNEGLIAQKERFGGRAVVYDTYEIDIR